MRLYTVVYFKKDSDPKIWTCNASRLLECIRKFEKEVGSWVDLVLDWCVKDDVTA